MTTTSHRKLGAKSRASRGNRGTRTKKTKPAPVLYGKAHSELLEDLDRAWYVPKRLEVWFDAEGSGDPRAPSFCRDVRFIRG
jgi:hypothetical protein